jgi:DNA ligase-associated metallophosphoesterase
VGDGVIAGVVSLCIAGEELRLHPGRAVFWPRRRTLIVADTHFGKSSFFARHGVAVPAGADAADRATLHRLVDETLAERLIVLGDFLHAPMAADSHEAHEIDAWSRGLAPKEVVVIAGNHDRLAAHPWPSIHWRQKDLLDPPFRFLHDASTRSDRDAAFTLSGHIHPVMRLGGLRKSGLRVPVFWQRQTGLVLPSFGAFTGGFAVRPAPGDHLFAVGPTAVTPLG